MSTINPDDDMTDEQVEHNRSKLQTAIDFRIPETWHVRVEDTIPPTRIKYEFVYLHGEHKERDRDLLISVVEKILPHGDILLCRI